LGPASTANDPFIRRETTGHNLWKTGTKLQIEKLKGDRDALVAELDKEKSKGADTYTISGLEQKIADINAQLASKGHSDDKKDDAHGHGKGQQQLTQQQLAAAAAATGKRTATASGLTVDIADKEESWKLGKLTIDEVCSKVKRRLGFDPFQLSKMPKRDRFGCTVFGQMSSFWN
jgi:hypothetical protein